MGIPLVDLRQDRTSYYLQLGYSPDFYETLARFEAAIPRDRRRYRPELGMWQVSKQAAERLPEFFDNFAVLAAQPARPLRTIQDYIPYGTLARVAAVATIVLLGVFAWRSGKLTTTVQSSVARLPAPVSGVLDLPDRVKTALATVKDPAPRVAGNKTTLASLVPVGGARAVRANIPADAPITALPSDGKLPAACRGKDTPLGLSYVSAGQANLHEKADSQSKVFGTLNKGQTVCVYKTEGAWVGGTIEGREETVWLYQPLLSATPPKAD